MSLRLYNTLTRKKEIFKPIEEGKVGLYSCGPTVYWYQHLGNLKAYIFSDILKRALLFNGYKVKHVINVTDVGHLTSDADTGDDKMEKAAKKEGKKAEDIARYYFDLFHKDLEKLNVLEPDVWCWATEHIKEQIALIKTLEKKGYTYKTSDGVYFDTSKIDKKEYSRLGRLNLEGLEAGKRIDLGEKKNKTDFALWKFSPKDENRQQEWDSPWGVGFPGWHIECSAMSMKYLGEQFDIHTGGQEHIQVHHTNEIAQSECATGKRPWVKYWLHQQWLIHESGDKMSKSKGGIMTLSEIEEKGYSPMDYRYFILLTHYRKPVVFTLKHLDAAKNALSRLRNILSELKNSKEKVNSKKIELVKKEFMSFINDDLNLPRAVSYMWEILRDDKLTEAEKYKSVIEFDKVFGLSLGKEEKIEIPKEINELLEKRNKARMNKDFTTADKYRDEIAEKGFVIEDKDGRSVVKKG